MKMNTITFKGANHSPQWGEKYIATRLLNII